MKIKSVHIDGFGKWQDVDFSLSDNPQVIFGSNEAGKTTLVHFIISILFGFANGRGKNKYDQYKPKNGGSYGGSITIAVDDKEYVIHRGPGKGGGKVTVTDPDGHTAGKGALTKLLGPIDQELYQDIYCFSAQDLATVDDVDRQQVSAELKQVGAAGSQQWLTVSHQLSKEAATIYRERGRKWPLNQKLKQAAQLSDQLKSAQAKSGDYEHLVQVRKQTLQELAKVRSQEKAARQVGDHLGHLSQLWPVYQSLQATQDDPTQGKVDDQDITTVQQLRADEQTLTKTQDRQRSQVADQKAKLAGLEDADIEFYRQHEPDLKAAQTNAMRLQAARDNDELTAQKVKQWQKELDQLQTKYDTTNLPLPLHDHDRTELADLINLLDQDSHHQVQQLSWPPVVAAGVGVLLTLFGLLVRTSFLIPIGLFLVVVGVGAVFYRRHQQTQLAEKAHRDHSDALKQFGFDHQLQDYPAKDWLPMQTDLSRAVDLKAQIDDANQRIQLTQQRIKQTMAEFPRFGHDSLTDWLANLNAFVNRMAQRDVELRAVSQRFQTANSALAETTDQLAELTKQKQAIYHQAGVKDDQEFDQLLTKRTAALTNRAKARGYAAQLSDEDRTALSNFADGDALQLAVKQNQAKVADLTQREHELDETARQAKVEIDAMVKDGTLSDLQQQMADLNTQIWDDTADWLAHQLAVRWIDAALSKASAGRFPEIVNAAKDYFATLTGDHYGQINLTDSGIEVVDSKGTQFDVQELSQGTAEQLYVALRLGFARVMSKNLSLPLIIDDGFVNFDNVRKQRMLKLLKQVATTNQVVYLTADSRIKDSDLAVLDLDERGTGNEQAAE